MKVIRLCCWVAMLSLLGGNAISQTKVGDRIGDWVFRCQAVTATQSNCFIDQSLAEEKSKREIARLTLRKVGADGDLALLVRVPLGVHLATGLAGKVDNGEQFAFIWQSCTQQGCVGAVMVEEGLRWALAKGKDLMIGFKVRPDSKTLTIKASLDGIAMGLQAIGVR